MRHGGYEQAGSGGGGGSSGGGERAFSWRHCSVRGRGDGDGGGRHGAGAVRPIARRMAPLATFTFTLATFTFTLATFTFTFTLATFTFTFTLASGLAPPFARFVALVALVARSRRRAMMLALGSAMMLALSLALATALIALERPMGRFRQQRAQTFAHVIDGARDGVVEASGHVTKPFAHLLAEVIEPLGPIPEHIREQVGAVLAWLLAALAAPAAVLRAVAGAFGLGLGRDAEEVGAA